MTLKAAKLVYKGTILPILEYADFIHDFGIKYINKRLQTIQNTGLYIVFNQHFISYELRDSTETIHRRANVYRLAHRRWIHMLLFIYNYKDRQPFLDLRDINTRRRNGILFSINEIDHYKTRQDPMLRAMKMWNSLPVQTRNAESKSMLNTMLKNSIPNPFCKVY